MILLRTGTFGGTSLCRASSTAPCGIAQHPALGGKRALLSNRLNLHPRPIRSAGGYLHEPAHAQQPRDETAHQSATRSGGV